MLYTSNPADAFQFQSSRKILKKYRSHIRRLGVVFGLPKNIMNHVKHSPCIAIANDFCLQCMLKCCSTTSW